MLERIFQQNPKNIALLQGNIIYTYRQLYAEAQQLAAFLKQGGGPLLVCGHKHPRMIVSLLACLLSGRAWVPCDVSLPAARIQEIAKLCGAAQLFLAEDSRPEIDVPAFSWENVPETDETFVFQPKSSALAYIMFTSGTSGTPKGIPISVGNVDNFARWLLSHQELEQAARHCVINQANLSFDLSVADWCAALCSGGTLLLTTKAEQFRLRDFFCRIREQRGSFLVCTPTFLRLCLCDKSFCRENLPNLQAVFLCGEVLPRSTAALTLQRFPQLALFNAYGPTEATCAVCGLMIKAEHLEQEPLPVGEVASAAVEITLDGSEICLEGASLFQSYLGQSPAAIPYHTGDLGTIEDGLLYCLGRKDSQIKYMGYRIDLEEIRLALEALPEIRQAAVVPLRDASGTVRKLAAYVSPLLKDMEALRRQLARQLPQYMLPSLFYPLEQLPVTTNVKKKTR